LKGTHLAVMGWEVLAPQNAWGKKITGGVQQVEGGKSGPVEKGQETRLPGGGHAQMAGGPACGPQKKYQKEAKAFFVGRGPDEKI